MVKLLCKLTMTNKSKHPHTSSKEEWGIVLSHQDSNLGKQNQNLVCYHYTMRQSFYKKRCKDTNYFKKRGKN